MGTNLGLLAYSEGIFWSARVCKFPYVTAILNAFSIKGVGVRLKNEVGEGGGRKCSLRSFPPPSLPSLAFPSPLRF